MASPSAVLASAAVVEFVPPFAIGTVPKPMSPVAESVIGDEALMATVPLASGNVIVLAPVGSVTVSVVSLALSVAPAYTKSTPAINLTFSLENDVGANDGIDNLTSSWSLFLTTTKSN